MFSLDFELVVLSRTESDDVTQQAHQLSVFLPRKNRLYPYKLIVGRSLLTQAFIRKTVTCTISCTQANLVRTAAVRQHGIRT